MTSASERREEKERVRAFELTKLATVEAAFSTKRSERAKSLSAALGKSVSARVCVSVSVSEAFVSFRPRNERMDGRNCRRLQFSGG